MENKNSSITAYKGDFEAIYGIIASHRDRVVQQVNVPSKTAQNPNRQIVPIRSAQIQAKVIVPIQLAQIPTVLFSTGWSNHQLIMNYCKTDEQRLFYMLYAGRERLEYKELDRAIKTDAMSAILGSRDVQSQMLQTQYPQAPLLFKDRISLDMLGLPLNFLDDSEKKRK